MVQPLPKTDSREFEIGNPEAPPVAPDLAVSESECEISIRTWVKTDLAIDSLKTFWATKTTLVELIADLIVAGDGRVADQLPLAMLARFPNAIRALTAAKPIQRSLPIFAIACSESDCSVSTVISNPTESGSTDFEKTAQAPGNLLNYPRPGGIVITEHVCEELQVVPRLHLRKIDSGDGEGSDAKATMHELVWAPVPYSAETSDAPEPSLRSSVEKPAISAASSGTEPVTSASPKKKAEVPDLSARKIPRSRSPASAPRRAFSSGADLSNLAEDTVVSRSRHALIGAALALTTTLLLVFSVLLFLPYRRQAETRARQSAPNGDQTKQQNQTALATTQRVPGNPDAHNDSGPPSQASATLMPEPRNGSAKKVRNKESEDQREKPSSADGYFYSKIPYLLIKAERGVGSGKYSEARHEYQVVLSLDPANSKAKQGLHRLELRAREPNN
jgi:hypothetical protein